MIFFWCGPEFVEVEVTRKTTVLKMREAVEALLDRPASHIYGEDGRVVSDKATVEDLYYGEVMSGKLSIKLPLKLVPEHDENCNVKQGQSSRFALENSYFNGSFPYVHDPAFGAFVFSAIALHQAQVALLQRKRQYRRDVN